MKTATRYSCLCRPGRPCGCQRHLHPAWYRPATAVCVSTLWDAAYSTGEPQRCDVCRSCRHLKQSVLIGPSGLAVSPRGIAQVSVLSSALPPSNHVFNSHKHQIFWSLALYMHSNAQLAPHTGHSRTTLTSLHEPRLAALQMMIRGTGYSLLNPAPSSRSGEVAGAGTRRRWTAHGHPCQSGTLGQGSWVRPQIKGGPAAAAAAEAQVVMGARRRVEWMNRRCRRRF